MKDIIFAFVLSLLFLSPFILLIYDCATRPPETTRIMSASMDQSVQGQFSLFGGSINEEPNYYFYVKDGDGKMLESSVADNTRLIETDEREPTFVDYPCTRTDILYVPENTTVLDYEVRQPGLTGEKRSDE